MHVQGYCFHMYVFMLHSDVTCDNYKLKQEENMVAKKKAKKAPVKKAPAKKASPKKDPAKKVTAVKQVMTKAAIMTEISGNTGLSKKQVMSVFDELSIVIERHIKKRSAGKFLLPGLMKIQVKSKPATKAKKGRNPFTGEEMMFKAKPASRVVKIQPLKKLKEMTE
jgi:nucleoid DNA-binding protein